MAACTRVLDGDPPPDARDASNPDVGPDVVASRDGGDAASDTGPFCAAFVDAAFCEDFDVGEVEWNDTRIEGYPSAVAISEDASFSPPRSLRAAWGSTDASFASARVAKAVVNPAGGSKLHVELDFHADRFSSTGLVRQLFRVHAAAERPSVSLVSSANGIVVVYEGSFDPAQDADVSRVSSPPLAMPVGAWAHLVLDVDFSTSGSIRFAVDGVDNVSLTGVFLKSLGNDAMWLWLGNETLDAVPPQPIETLFDNVVMTLPP